MPSLAELASTPPERPWLAKGFVSGNCASCGAEGDFPGACRKNAQETGAIRSAPGPRPPSFRRAAAKALFRPGPAPAPRLRRISLPSPFRRTAAPQAFRRPVAPSGGRPGARPACLCKPCGAALRIRSARGRPPADGPGSAASTDGRRTPPPQSPSAPQAPSPPQVQDDRPGAPDPAGVCRSGRRRGPAACERACGAGARAVLALGLSHPVAQRFARTTDCRRDRRDRGPWRALLILRVQDHPDCAGGRLGTGGRDSLRHGSSFSKVGASGQPRSRNPTPSSRSFRSTPPRGGRPVIVWVGSSAP